MTVLYWLGRDLRHIRDVLAATPWQSSALWACLLGLIPALSLLFYPDVYSLSRSYAWLSRNHWSPHWLGGFGLLSALWTLLLLRYQAGILGLYGLLIFVLILACTALASVGLSASSGYALLTAVLALRAFWRSGGLLGRD